ncbi:MAG: MerR family DNA-binding transcriptional regulator [Burkholderiales bacterium]|nr:MerR family DNA-binding transcriptional regulator [Burkholderiales bacterium]MDP2399805.1 MerR family DNA-binding transcriptional regulator [Burkholderiales bacterium]MDP3714885.1 MerR family DNA-binding transcriptional regulator [Burkholderiales bacterium]
MSKTYSISDLSHEFGVTTRTLRHYEDQGLVSPARDGINRIYSHRDRVRLKLALRAKRLGFTLSEIRELFQLYDLANDERRQLEEFAIKLERRRTQLEQQREDVEVMLNEIIFFATQCQRLLTESDAGKAAKP